AFRQVGDFQPNTQLAKSLLKEPGLPRTRTAGEAVKIDEAAHFRLGRGLGRTFEPGERHCDPFRQKSPQIIDLPQMKVKVPMQVNQIMVRRERGLENALRVRRRQLVVREPRYDTYDHVFDLAHALDQV